MRFTQTIRLYSGQFGENIGDRQKDVVNFEQAQYFNFRLYVMPE
ncbi:hypothetical protein AB4Z52_17525 [Rhizobium sp. 2YAF20]